MYLPPSSLLEDQAPWVADKILGIVEVNLLEEAAMELDKLVVMSVEPTLFDPGFHPSTDPGYIVEVWLDGQLVTHDHAWPLSETYSVTVQDMVVLMVVVRPVPGA